MARGADPTIQDMDGYSPWLVGVIEASLNNETKIVEALISGGVSSSSILDSIPAFVAGFLKSKG